MWNVEKRTFHTPFLSAVNSQRSAAGGRPAPAFLSAGGGGSLGGGRPLWQGFLAPLLLVGDGTLGGVIPLWLLRKKDIAPYL